VVGVQCARSHAVKREHQPRYLTSQHTNEFSSSHHEINSHQYDLEAARHTDISLSLNLNHYSPSHKTSFHDTTILQHVSPNHANHSAARPSSTYSREPRYSSRCCSSRTKSYTKAKCSFRTGFCGLSKAKVYARLRL
jgi:hypothetical protein